MKYFETFVLIMIIFSTILLTLDNPLNDPKGKRVMILEDIDIVVSTIFAVESLLKIIVQGFLFNGKDSYIRNPWNIIDFVIVVFSLISIMAAGVNLKFIKALRMLRVLRPLRMISRNPALKIAV